ncbi:Plasmid stabilization system protein [Botrimarina colliarenosi]|uniref:Plasmid stabilization system protein n=1 Tax=Botrimarina colliarenosi TaxID=2528001 RepID=A0A5C6ACK4_9BACT|nr:type II toxin-antitoxin system RelE/ParE family toxin [Botrimarina colliarenosi]TWT96885.1 Plasmid stabilization system protein [Botrimarina colliarenosi]
MTRRLVYTPESLIDIESARDWYEGASEGLGGAFLDQLEACVELVAQFPEAFTRHQGPLRVANLRRYPYVVVYEFDRSEIRIAAVVHTARGPYYWQERFGE